MSVKINDFVVEVATVNGSGSQSSNNILMRTIFRMGVPVEGKNLFPSNIQGMPTWFTIRVHEKGHLSRKEKADIVVAMNPKTALEDVKKLKPGGLFFYNSDMRADFSQLDPEVEAVGIGFRKLVSEATDSIQLKKLLTNMVYVGVLAELLELDETLLADTIRDQFQGKEKVFDVNLKAIEVGKKYAQAELSSLKGRYQVQARDANAGKILMDGNSAAGLGMVMGGASFMSWYPITPSSSLAETFIELSALQASEAGERRQATVQAEDELSAISMVMGAGWAGSRAFTTTSGPGLSLMSEAAGLMYFAEIPGVLWDVQRMGPSTGLPTRTSQGDLLAAHHLSHGDTEHIVLLPGTTEECFEFAQVALDAAERFQTLVIVLSDLDLGMNYWITKTPSYPEKPFDRGKVLSAADLEKLESFARYKDVDGDGVPYRTLPGTEHELAAYFTRGTGHTPTGAYSEDPENYKELLDRIQRKIQGSASYLPAPVVQGQGSRVGVMAFGSTDAAIPELLALLEAKGQNADYMRVRALPLAGSVEKFLADHETVVVIEQNRDGQLKNILSSRFADHAAKLKSIRVYDGLPVSAESLLRQWQELF